MYFKNTHLLVLTTVCAALLAACGGGSSSSGALTAAPVPEPEPQVLTAAAIPTFVDDMIVKAKDEDGPVDISKLTMNEDDTAEPVVLK